jgi:hypothetical protein
MSATDGREPKVGAEFVNPGVPPASISLAQRWWNWLWGIETPAPAPAPPPEPPPPPPPEQPVALRGDVSGDDWPSIVQFPSEGPTRDC